MKTNKLLLSALALTIYSTSFGQYIPQDFNDEPAYPSHAYWQASGQILDTEGHPVEDLRYYTMGTGPKIFLFDEKISLVHYFTDTIVTDTTWRLDMQFVCNPEGGEEPPTTDAAPDPEPCGTLSAHEITPGKLNYYVPHTGAGLVGVDGYHRVIYENAWPNIDFHFYSNAIGLKCYIVVHPGGDPNDILFQFTGQDQITTPIPGTIKMHLGSRNVKFPQAFAWQEVAGTPTPLMWLPTWNNLGSGQVDVTTGNYDTSKPLVLQIGGDLDQDGQENDDPNDNSNWSTYVGDNLLDEAEDLDTDTDGDIYEVGSTQSAQFPVGQGQSTYEVQSYDVFVTKFLKVNRSLRWTTFIGGTDVDLGQAVDHDGVNKVYATGLSNSSTMIPGSPFVNGGNYSQAGHGSFDGFLFRLDDTDGDLEWVTHFGGSGYDRGNAVFADGSDVFITGYTQSANASQTCSVAGSNQLSLCDAGSNAYFQSSFGGERDAFFARFNSSGSLTHSTYVGGDGADQAFGISLDANDKLVLIGETDSDNTPSNVTSPCGVPGTGEFPLCDLGGSSYYQDERPSSFIMRFQDDLELEWGTYFGTTFSGGEASDLAFNSSNDLVVTGLNTLLSSVSTSLTCSAPTTNSFPICASGNEYQETYAGDSTIGRQNIYIARFDEDAELTWSTLYGEWSNLQFGPSITIDDDDNMYVAGVAVNQPNTFGVPNGQFPGQYFGGYYQQWDFGQLDSFDLDAYLIAFDVNNERQWATLFGGALASGTFDHDRDDRGLAITSYEDEELLIGGLSRSLDLYQACSIPGTSYCQPQLSDLSQDAYITLFNIEWLVTQIEEIENSANHFLIYPNPVSDVLNIDLTNMSAASELSIWSIDGRLIRTQNLGANSELLSISTSELNSGVYLLILSSDEVTQTVRFVKQ